ncbi:membrane hypothetical protein [Arthrobacter sp. 9AX]|uniref:DUF998 domain-containing protein n=1 Tax=Arthrobacter sp. 9AX TaxID=2653131 RepID=UPI0012F40A06|nr:DUF998 domain-containing protein [Arthrobacter sp. 9AX]VXC21486.1 membrane hypothetical protein [Arthrobacter sp. 9AX]
MSIARGRLPQRRLGAAFASARRDAVRRALLTAGPLSSLLYVVFTDGFAASRWDGYRRMEQMVSELFAVGSPGRDVLLPFTWFYTVLFTAFGVGVWISASGHRPLRIGGALLTAYGLFNIVGALYPLTLGDDTSIPMHIVATNITLALMVAAMCFVAAGFHGRMRVYSITSLVVSALMGMVAFMAAPGPNLVLGVGERISIGAFLLWVAVLAVALWNGSTARTATGCLMRTGIRTGCRERAGRRPSRPSLGANTAGTEMATRPACCIPGRLETRLRDS